MINTYLIEVLIGAPGSGKTTYAEKRIEEDKNCVVISRDSYRKMFKLAFGNSTDKVEKVITTALYENLRLLMNGKFNIIIDNTHCRMEVINELMQHITKYDRHNLYKIKFQIFDPPLKELYSRNIMRPKDKQVPTEVIDRMFKNLQVVLNYQNRKLLSQYEDGLKSFTIPDRLYNDKLNDCVIVDIDGTVAHMNGKRGPFDWNKVDLDDPDESIISLVYLLASKYKIVFMSGRSEDARKLTELWLDVHMPTIGYELHMRGSNDFRKDSIVKRELFETHIASMYNVLYVLDDRQQVVDMWRNELGLKVLQVAEGNF